jgi:hypothetical protein
VIEQKDLTVILPCIYDSEEPLWMMMATCRRFGITPTFFGKGEVYAGWVDIMLVKLAEAARTCPTSHMLYSDSRDAFFLTGLREVVENYNAMGCPPLMLGSDCVGFDSYKAWYDKVPWDKTKAFPYFQVGGKIGEAKAIYEAITWMLKKAKSGEWGEMPGDNPPYWCNFMVERPGELTIDHECQIFQNCTEAMHCLDVREPLWWPIRRIYNSETDSWPCILHFNGGYTSQTEGKWYRMEEMWRRLGYVENPPWERT